MNWYLLALSKYAVFSGRSRRKEFWYFTLINSIIYFVLSFIDMKISARYQIKSVFSVLYALGLFLPAIGVHVRRLHDIGRSGWWYCLVFIPIIGYIIILFWAAKESQPGANEYGPNPITS